MPDQVETQPVFESDPAEDKVETDTVTEKPEQTHDDLTFGATEDSEDNKTQNQEVTPKNSLRWIIVVGAGVLVICGAVVLILNNKKKS